MHLILLFHICFLYDSLELAQLYTVIQGSTDQWYNLATYQTKEVLKVGMGDKPTTKEVPKVGTGDKPKTKEVPKVGTGDKPQISKVLNVGMGDNPQNKQSAQGGGGEAPVVHVEEPPQRNIKFEQDRKKCSTDTDGKNPHENKRVHRDTCVSDLVWPICEIDNSEYSK